MIANAPQAGPSPNAAASAHDDKLALDQLDLALRYLRPYPFLMPIFGAVICAIFSRWIAWPTLLVWFGLLTASLVPLLIVQRAFQRAKPEPSAARKWEVYATGTYALSLAGWVSIVLLLWAPASDLSHLLIVLLLAGFLSGGAASVGPSRPLALALFLVDGSALTLAPLRVGEGLSYSVTIIGFFYTIYNLHLAWQTYSTARDMLMLRNDKSDLIVALGNAKMDSDLARSRAESANKSKTAFLANMSHELRTPLNAIIGFSEMIASRAFAGNVEKHAEYAEHVKKSGQHLLALINDVLDLAKIEAGAIQLTEVEVDLGRLAADEAELMHHRAEAAGSSLVVDACKDLPLVYADERAMKQILLNLLSNAIKFTPRGGRITVFARTEPGASVVFGVTDTGIGIAAEDQVKVFEEYGQVRHDVVQPDKGTGLGLPIVKGLVEAHEGRITLESRAGQGTTVTVYLPAARSRKRAMVQAA